MLVTMNNFECSDLNFLTFSKYFWPKFLYSFMAINYYNVIHMTENFLHFSWLLYMYRGDF